MGQNLLDRAEGSQAARAGDVALEMRQVVRSYGTGEARVRALDGVDLTLDAGSWVAVMGPSGSGKSTLLQCAAGLDGVDAGQVLLFGEDLAGADDRRLTRLRRDTVGFVFQNFNLVASLTAEQNVALPLRLAGRRVGGAEVRRALDGVGLGDRGRHRPRELSGGQQQRVAIARAMVAKPKVLFADEPTGALDSTSARVVLSLLRRMVDGAGQTIAMVTHDPIAAAAADAVVFLADGRVVDRMERPSARRVAERLASLEV
ncbi:ABC transporter ATP-binding protein [Yinghuangia soli]|uniref:ABC transporter ATP-binding protein n=1 Tax=Yinghuangia soli TaxID=2908204 RepID=A0AA41Q663_9ACTN|nr:ABC transporter ATP-binding protein [Yinghuangia soli]MCF2531396.1 ABC transporter ATP-binding protein [Yinghuangia soli]